MSKVVDEKVVEMKFDNSHFEKNVQGTLSTLDKLKAKLNLSGASKGLENVQKSVDNMDFSRMSNSLLAIENRFSTMGIVGMTVIQNLTNTMIGFVKKAADFSIGGVISGGKARATKIENAKFQIKGLLRDYTDAQERLDAIMKDVNYGVESTAYGLDAAASVAAQLVASGMEAGDNMRAALRGISGVAAMTNSTYEDIGRIYTTVAGNGRLMGDQLLQLSSRGMNAAAVLSKSLGKTEAEVREMVSKGKISFEMFSKAMDDAFGEHAKDANKTLNGVISNIKAALAKIGADFYGPLIAENSPLVLFLNSVRERINEIRKTLNPITKEVTDRINKFITALDNAFKTINPLGYNPLDSIKSKIQEIKAIMDGITGPLKNAANAMNAAGEALKDYDTLVNEIIHGDWGNQPVREKKLTEAGYSFAHAQNLVNERLGCSVRLEDDYVETTQQATMSTEEFVKSIEDLSDEELRNAGMTEEQIAALNELKKVAKKTGIPLKELIDILSDESSAFNTRFLILNSFKNIGLTIVSVLKSIGNAFRDVFSINNEWLFDLVAGFHKLTVIIRDRVENNAEKLTRTLRGLFSIVHIIVSFIGGGFKLVLNVVKGVLSAFNISILDVTAAIGDAIYNLDKWLTENNLFIEIIKTAVDLIVKAAIAARDWVQSNEQILFIVNKLKTAFANAGEAIKAWLKGLRETDNIPEYIFGGLINGIKENGPKVWEAIKTVAQGLIDTIKKVLQIHSPSKVMFAIGGFIIAGLIAGMQQQQLSLWDILGEFGAKIINFFKNLNIGDVIAVGITTGILITANKMLSILDKLTAPLVGLANMMTGIGDMLTDVGNAARDWGKAMKYQGLAAIIKSLAIALGVLVAALVILGKLPSDELKQGAIALSALIGVLAAFIVLLALMSKKLSTLKLPDVGKTLAVILGISVGMFILAKALKTISKIPSDQMVSSIFGLVACAAALGILIVVLSKVSEKFKGTKTIEKLGNVFLKIALSMLLVAVALKIMNSVQWESVGKLVTVVGMLAALLAGIAILNKFTKGGITKSAETISACAGALLLMVITMKLSGMLNEKDFKNGIIVMGLFLGFLTALLGISKIFKTTELVKVSGSIILIIGALGLMALVMKLLSNMDPKSITKGLICITLLSTIIGALIIVSKNSSSFHGTSLIGVGVAILAMTAAVWLLGQLDPEKAEKGLGAVSILSILVGGLIAVSKGMNAGKNAVKALTMISIMIALLAAAMIGLSFIEPDRLIPAAGALTSVITALAAAIFATNKLKMDKKGFAALLGMTLVVAALAGIIALLSTLPNTDGLIKSAISLSILVGGVALLAYAFSKIKIDTKDLKGIAIGILAITAMAIPLLAFVGVLQALSGIPVSLDSILTLVGLVTAMTLLLIPLTVLGTIAADSAGTVGLGIIIGIASLAGMALALLPFVAILQAMSGIPVATDAVRALIELTSAMTLLLIPLTVLGAIAIGTAGISAAATAIGIASLAAMALALGALVGILQAMAGIENAAENARALTDMAERLTGMLLALSLVAPLLIMVDVAIAGLVAIVAGIGVLATTIGALMTQYPQLEDFLNKGLPILEKIAGSIGTMLGKLVDGFMTAATANLGEIGSRLSEFAIRALPFIMIMQNVNDNLGKGIGYMVAAILGLSASNIIDKISTFLSGGQSFSRLGKELSEFATNALPFIMVMNMVKPGVMDAAKNMAEAILSLTGSNLLESITGWIGGTSDLSSFGSKLAGLGTGLSDFVSNLGTFTEDQVSTVECGANALVKIAEASDKIPKTGGIADFFAGTSDLAEFSGKMPEAAKGIRSFVEELTSGNSFTKDDVDVVECGANALVKIAEAAEKLPNSGGVNAFFNGDNDIKEFASKLGDVGKSIRGFVWELKQDNVITEDAIDIVYVVIDLLYAITSLGGINLGDTSGKLEELGARLSSMANKLKEFASSLVNMKKEDLETAKDRLLNIINLAKNISEVNSEPLEKFGESLKKIGSESINEFVKALNNDEPKDKSVEAIKKIVDAVCEKAKSKKEDVEKSVKVLSLAATESLYTDEIKKKVEEAGINFVSGFANAIKDNNNSVYNAAYNLGKRAVKAVNEATDEHSPSKETYKTGKFFVLGMVNGIKDFSNKLYTESYNVGDIAKNGLSKAIAKVASIIDSNMDTSPTIRPVLDLSDVENGVGTLNSMFGNPSIGVMSNLNAISSGINTESQNGGEIVNAINKLRKDLGSVTSNTYNINGVTYDNGSEIQEAVGTLVRAARIERRV